MLSKHNLLIIRKHQRFLEIRFFVIIFILFFLLFSWFIAVSSPHSFLSYFFTFKWNFGIFQTSTTNRTQANYKSECNTNLPCKLWGESCEGFHDKWNKCNGCGSRCRFINDSLILLTFWYHIRDWTITSIRCEIPTSLISSRIIVFCFCTICLHHIMNETPKNCDH